MALVSTKTGKQIPLNKGYESPSISYEEWKKRQEAPAMPPAPKALSADTSGEAWTSAVPSQAKSRDLETYGVTGTERRERARDLERQSLPQKTGRTVGAERKLSGSDKISAMTDRQIFALEKQQDAAGLYGETAERIRAEARKRRAASRKAPDLSDWTYGLTGTERRERQESVARQLEEMKDRRLEAYRNGLFNPEAATEIAKKEKELRASIGKQTLGDRLESGLSAVIHPAVRTVANAAGLGADTALAAVRRIDGPGDRAVTLQWIQRYEDALNTGRTWDGTAVTPELRAQFLEILQDLYQEYGETEAPVPFEERHPVLSPALTKARDDAYRVADQSRAAGAKAQEEAKAGLGKLGRLAADVGIAAGQMGVDAAIGSAFGLGVLGPMSFRSGSLAAQEARLAGADLGQQWAYGLGSGALSAATEQISNIAGPFRKIYGAGAAEKIAGKLAERFSTNTVVQIMTELSRSAGGRLALSALGEGFEEVVEGYLQPYLQRATYNPDAKHNWKEIGYEGLIGAALGGLGGTAEIAGQAAGRIAGRIAGTGAEAGPDGGLLKHHVPGAAWGDTDISYGSDALQGPQGGADVLVREAQRLAREEQARERAERTQTPDVMEREAQRLNQKKNTETVDEQARDDAVDQEYNELPPDLEETLYRFDPDAYQEMVEDADGATEMEAAKEHADRIAEDLRQKTREAFPEEAAQEGPDLLEILMGRKPGKKMDAAEILTDQQRRGEAAQARKEGSGQGDGLGAADAGFETRGLEGTEQTSRMAERMPFNKQMQDATAMTKEEYDRLFKYTSQTEGMTRYLGEELVYVMKDGQRTFLRDVNEDAYKALAESLRDAPAWTPEQMEAGMMIKDELAYQASQGLIPAEEFTDWIQVVREHQTVGGQAVQAISKWTRFDNRTGSKSRQAAFDTVEKSDLSPQQKAAKIKEIGDFTERINAVEEGDSAALQDIVLEIARTRGTTTGPVAKHLDGVLRGAMKDLSFAELKQFAFASTEALAQDTTPLDMGRAVRTVQVLNMLSAMTTPNRNLTGNTSFYALDAMTMDGAALLDMALSQITGTRSVAMGSSLVNRAMWDSAMKSARMSVLETALDVDMGRGETMYGTGGRRTFRAGAVRGEGKINGAKNFTERFLSALERNNGYLLTVPDEFFKGMARGHEGRLQALMDQGKIRTENSAYAVEQADALAKYRTFQDNSKIAAMTSLIHDVLNIAGIGDSGKRMGGFTVHNMGLGDLASPFARVAANLAARGVDYNPVRAAQGVLEMGQILYDAKHGKTVDPARQASAVSHTARGLSGTAVIGAFYMMLSAGLIRRADDKGNENVAALNRSEGRTGYQINLGAVERWIGGESVDWQNGDKLLDISYLQPFNELLGVADQIYHDDDKSVSSLLKDDVTGLMKAAGDMPILQTVGDLAKDLTVYKKDPTEAFGDALSNVLISSVTPNLLRSVAKGMDDRPRSINREDGFWNMVKDDFKNRIPGLRQTLPGYTDSTGEDKVYPGSRLGNFLNSTVNPMGLNTYDQTEQSQEWERLMEATGKTDFYPSARIPKELKGNGHVKELNFEERQEFQRQRGGYLMIAAADMLGHPLYQQKDDDGKVQLMTDVRDYAHEAAKADLLGEDSVAKWVTGLKKLQRETGLSAGDYLAYRRMYLDAQKEDGVNAGDVVREALRRDQRLSVEQKNAVDDLLISDVRIIPDEKNVDYSSDERFAITQMSAGAQKHWQAVKDGFGWMTPEKYDKAWEIFNRRGTKENPYLKEQKKRDLREELGISAAEAGRLYRILGMEVE